jgi:short-subunit dehydrogenase
MNNSEYYQGSPRKHRNPGDRVALVTGGSDGIGAACVRAFRAHGWSVSVAALPGRELDRQDGDNILTIGGDLALPPAREAAVERTLRRFGRIDVLVNSAGVGLFGVPSEVPLQWIPRLFDTNVFAPLALTKMVIPVMRRQGAGTIVNIGSVGGLVSLPWAAGYSASKAAFHSFHDSLRRELRGGPLHAIKVCPGIVDTRFREHALAGAAPAAVRKLRWVVSADAVARRILRAIDRRQNTVYVPRIGALFTLVGALAPALMDAYLARLLERGLHLKTPSAPRNRAPKRLLSDWGPAD